MASTLNSCDKLRGSDAVRQLREQGLTRVDHTIPNTEAKVAQLWFGEG